MFLPKEFYFQTWDIDFRASYIIDYTCWQCTNMLPQETVLQCTCSPGSSDFARKRYKTTLLLKIASGALPVPWYMKVVLKYKDDLDIYRWSPACKWVATPGRVVRNFWSRRRLNWSRRHTVFILDFYQQWGYERKLTTPWRRVWGSSPRKFCENMPSFSCQYFIHFACLLCMDTYFFDLTKK